MKKNLLTIAVTAALVTPAVSMAEATFYGHAQVEVGNIAYENDKVIDPVTKLKTNEDKPSMAVADNARGRIGMKATEDLGNGWKGLAVFEFKADTSDGDSSDKGVALTGREHMVGLKGPMGQIELGRLKQAYKYTGGVKYDAFVTTFLEARGNGGMSKPGKVNGVARAQWGHSGFHDKSVGYRNKFGPVKLSLTYGPSTNDGSMTFSAMYKQGGIEAFIAMVDAGDYIKFAGAADPTNPTAATDSASFSATKFGGSFKTGAHSIMLQIENQSQNTGISGAKDNEPAYTYLAYRMKMGKNVFALQYGTYDADGAKKGIEGNPTAASVDADLTYLAAGVVHNFSKDTRVFAGYRSTASDYDGRESAIGVGIRKTFKGGS